MDEINPISSTEKHNAIISYCFLAPLMLISQQEQFRSTFVRAHAKYASLLNLCFFILIIFLIRSQNFGSLLMFDALQFQASWDHILLFVLFGGVLLATFAGMISAMRGVHPQLWIHTRIIGNYINNTASQTIWEKEKIPVILSHLPFLGIYLSGKYGGNLISGARWWSWCFVIAALLVSVDSSFFLLVIWIILSTLWVVYQGVLVLSEDSIHLIGEKLPSSHDVHIFLRSLFQYSKRLFNHDNVLPVWSQILQQERWKYQEISTTVFSPIISLPFINIFPLFSIWKKQEWNSVHALQATLITLFMLYFILSGTMWGIMVMILASFFGFCQIHFSQKLNIPFLSEIALFWIMIRSWKHKKSIVQKENHTISPL